MGNAHICRGVSMACAIALCVWMSPRGFAGIVLDDEFETLNAARWNTNATVFTNPGAATDIGAPQVLQTETLDGNSVLRMRSTLANAQRRGIAEPTWTEKCR